VVKINKGHEIALGKDIELKELQNEGTLLRADNGTLSIVVSGMLVNRGEIASKDGVANELNRNGSDLDLQGSILQNEGTIKAGSGAAAENAETYGGDGGNIQLNFGQLVNKPTAFILAGNGGNASKGETGGKGGNISLKGQKVAQPFFLSSARLNEDTPSQTLVNEGGIQSGAGGNGQLEGGKGGDLELTATQLANNATGQIVAGSGGDSTVTVGDGSGLSGKITARSDGAISNQGAITIKSKISALDLLQCQKGLLSKTWCKKVMQEKEVEQQQLKLVVIQKHSSAGNITNTVSLGGKISVAGKIQVMAASGESQQVAGGIKISGSDTSIEAGSLELATGPGMTINLVDMASGAINVTTGVTLTTGLGGAINLQNVTGVISATKVTLGTEKVETGNSDLKTIIGENVEQLPSQTLGKASFGQTASLHTVPGQALTTTVTLYNDSPTQNIYTFTVMIEIPDWTVKGLPTTQIINSFAAADLQLVISPPSKATIGDRALLVLVAQAQGDPKLGTSASFNLAVEAPPAITPTPTMTSTPKRTPSPTVTVTRTPTPFPTLTAPCTCPLIWLAQGNCESSNLTPTSVQSSTLDLNTFYKVRDLLQKGAKGQKYIKLYEQYVPEITTLLFKDSTFRAQVLKTLLLWQPKLQALVAGQGASLQATENLITADMTQAAEASLQALAANGSSALQQVVKNEILAENPLAQLVGKTMTQAQEQVAPVGWRNYLPLIIR